MKSIIAFAAALLFAVPAIAGTFKCVGKNGSTLYQDGPCDDATQSSTQLQISNSPYVASEKKPSDQFFEDRFNKGDFAGALNFATSDKQRSRALAAKAKQESECKIKKIKAEEARANAKVQGARQKHAAEAAEAIYASACKYVR
jgi:hypothetical protein